MGVLGFIDRYRNNASGNTPTRNSDTSFDDVNAKLNDVWTQEFSRLFAHNANATTVQKTQVQLPTRYLILKIKIFMKTEQLI